MSGYIGNIPVPQATQTRQSFTATASQTTFNTAGYTAGFIDVFLNGIKLVDGTDYTATNGSDVVLTTGAAVSDVLDVVMYAPFDVVNTSLTDATINNTLTLKNATEEDTDGGRESTIIFKGEQSGGEISTLAEIEASHDGTADDEKGDLIFRTNDGSDGNTPTERMRVDSSGTLLVGRTTTPPTAGAKIALGSTGDTAVQITKDGVVAGRVMAVTTGLAFGVDGSDGATERMRIDNSGQVSIGATSSSGGILHLEDSNVVLTSKVTFGTPANAVNIQGLNNVGTTTFQVWGDGDTENSNNSYGAISDQTLKENIVDAGSQWDDIKSLQVRKYSFISDSLDAPNQIGVIAQELEASGMSGLVKNNPLFDESGDPTGETRKSVKYSILYMKAVKALQEAMDRIETLETKVAALENPA